MDPYLKRMQEYAANNRRKTIEQAVGGEQEQPAAPASAPTMSQADFAGKKTPDTPSRRAKLAELLKKQAQE